MVLHSLVNHGLFARFAKLPPAKLSRYTSILVLNNPKVGIKTTTIDTAPRTWFNNARYIISVLLRWNAFENFVACVVPVPVVCMYSLVFLCF